MGVSCSIIFESYAVATNAGSQLNSVSRQKEMVDIRMAVMDSWANMKEPAARSSKCSSSALRAPGKGVGGSGCNSGQHVEAKRATSERRGAPLEKDGSSRIIHILCMQVRSSSLSYRIVSVLRSCSSRDPSVGASWTVLPNLGWGVRGAALSEPCPCSVLMGVGGSAFSGEALLSFGAASSGRPGPPSSGAGSTDAERPIRRQRSGSASSCVLCVTLGRNVARRVGGARFSYSYTVHHGL